MSFSFGLKSEEDDESSSSEDESNLALFAFSSSNAILFLDSIMSPNKFSFIFSRRDAILSRCGEALEGGKVVTEVV